MCIFVGYTLLIYSTVFYTTNFPLVTYIDMSVNTSWWICSIGCIMELSAPQYHSFSCHRLHGESNESLFVLSQPRLF